MNIWKLFPTFDVGWGCGHTDIFTINVLKEIKKKYTIDEYFGRTNTYIVEEVCPYCEKSIKQDIDFC